MSQTQSTTRIVEVGRVMVPASDPDKALEFYVGKLGFEKLVDTPFGDGLRWIEVAPPGSHTPIALVPPREGDPTGIDTHFSLTSEDIDATYAELRDRGVDVDEQIMRMPAPVPPLFWFRDQDGNTLMVVQPS